VVDFVVRQNNVKWKSRETIDKEPSHEVVEEDFLLTIGYLSINDEVEIVIIVRRNEGEEDINDKKAIYDITHYVSPLHRVISVIEKAHFKRNKDAGVDNCSESTTSTLEGGCPR
jgi:hypothetical protein